MRGDGRVFQRGKRWWIAYYARGQEHRESAGRTEREARRHLKARLKEIYGGRFVGLQEERIVVEELLDDLLASFEMRGIQSLRSVRSHLKPVREWFRDVRARDLTTAAVERFMRDRIAADKAPATVNREVQLLKQALNLARKQERLTRVPYIPLLREDNARQGFFERDELEAVVAYLADPIDDITRFAYLSGWRKGEILSLRWEAVDRVGREVSLTTSKNGQGRLLPLVGELWELMESRWAARAFPSADGVTSLSDYVFHVRGRPVVDFKRSWKTACKKAGVPGRLFHDLRRTAVRNMVRAGVPQSVAMSISGHRTVSMFLRYNITSEDDMRLALARTQAHLESLPVRDDEDDVVGAGVETEHGQKADNSHLRSKNGSRPIAVTRCHST